eukprot:TRINITY_DN38_c0_g1_i1.p1 TRINITY_DN38_c0_g1~~TRINITY_DN38_c0_g1_i1.p1  ORF type:complete len:207 (+),score=47.05 TRINITY_DN38_c0_g1_i1:89-709(+)
MTERQTHIIIDGRAHLLGRLASTVAKNLLAGQRIVIVRAEEVEMSGSFFRNKLKYLSFLRKRTNVNPKKGPLHLRAPSKILWRTIRGMLPHRTKRGAAALDRLKVFEGIPAPYNKMKRKVVPSALRLTCLKPNSTYCQLGRLSSEVGWKHQAVIEKLEARRKIKSAAFYQRKKARLRLQAKATSNLLKASDSKLVKVNTELAKFGY